MEKSKVYFTKEITPESLIKIYEAMGKELPGKVAVKLSTGEAGGDYYLNPNLIKDLVHKVNGTIIECNTAYAGKRNTTKDHWETIKDHGFMEIAKVDIMDEEGDMAIPVENGFHLKENYVGEHLKNYDSILVLSHFKGHAMGGFGGALKNISIGIGSSNGKAWIHTAGKTKKPEELWDNLPEQDHFLESMADASKAVIDYIGKENMLYINVANNLSVDCDCDSNPHVPEMADLGIFASVDPVALDQACYDAVINAEDPGKKALIERMDSRHGIHTVEAANKLGIGNREYEIVNI